MRKITALSGIAVHLLVLVLVLLMFYVFSMGSFMVLGTGVKEGTLIWWVGGWALLAATGAGAGAILLTQDSKGSWAPAALLLLCSFAGLFLTVLLSLADGGFSPSAIAVIILIAYAVQIGITLLFLVHR